MLVNNAGFQMRHQTLEEISDDEWDHTFKLNVGAYFYLTKAALPFMPSGSSIIGSSSVNSDSPNPTLAPYAATKAAMANFSASLAQLLGDRGIRVNSVVPESIWTPLIPSTVPAEKVKSLAKTCRWAAPVSRSSWHRSTCCWPSTRQATSRARGWPLPAAGRFFKRAPPDRQHHR